MIPTPDDVFDAHSSIVGAATLINNERIGELPAYLDGYSPLELQLLVVSATSQLCALVDRVCQGSYWFDGTPQEWFAQYGHNIARRRDEWPEA